MTPAVWQAHIASLEAMATQMTSDPQQLVQRDIARGRLWRIKQVAAALVTDARKANVMSKWRSRSRTLWTVAGQEDKKDRKRDAGVSDAVDGELRREIDELQNSAPRSKDATSIQRAAAAERWVDEVVGKLNAAQSNAHRCPSRTKWDPCAPLPLGPLALSPPGGVPDILAMIDSLRKPRLQEATSGDNDQRNVAASSVAGDDPYDA